MDKLIISLDKARSLISEQDWDCSYNYLQSLLLQFPQSAEICFLLGLTSQHKANLTQETEAWLQKAIALNSQEWRYHANLAQYYQEQGRYLSAISSYQQAISLLPQLPELHLNLGNCYQSTRQYHEAQSCYKKALKINSQFNLAHFQLGQIFEQQEKWDEAEAHYLQAHQSDSNWTEPYLCLENIWFNQGLRLYHKKSYTEAQQYFLNRLQHFPHSACLLAGLGTIAMLERHFTEAIDQLHLALKYNPHFAAAYSNLGYCHQMLGHHTEALSCFDRALTLQPDLRDARWNRSWSLLIQGQFTEGWADYEFRQTMVPPTFPRWQGQPFSQKNLLIVCEQGLGDTIQFIRYIKLVKPLGGNIYVQAPSSLQRLLGTCPEISGFYPQENHSQIDYYIPLLSLPHLFNTQLDSIPSSHNVFHIPSTAVHNTLPTVGLVWAGNPENKRDRDRSIPLQEFSPLLDVAHLRWISLQKGTALQELTSHPQYASIIEDQGGRCHDFYDTALLLQNIDLLITCCSAPAHLAASLDIPTWVILGHNPDWRWLLGRDDSPWYPSVRLFRRKDWQEPWACTIQKVLAALQQWKASRGP